MKLNKICALLAMTLSLEVCANASLVIRELVRVGMQSHTGKAVISNTLNVASPSVNVFSLEKVIRDNETLINHLAAKFEDLPRTTGNSIDLINRALVNELIGKVPKSILRYKSFWGQLE